MAGESQTTQFVILSLLFLDISVIRLSRPPSFFGHLASVNRPLTYALRYLRPDGLCDVKGTHIIPPKSHCKNISLRTSNNVIVFNLKGKRLDVDDIQVGLQFDLSSMPPCCMSHEECLPWHQWHVAKLGSIPVLIYGNPGNRNK